MDGGDHRERRSPGRGRDRRTAARAPGHPGRAGHRTIRHRGRGPSDREGLQAGRLLSAGFDLSPETLRLIDAGHIRYTVDQQPYIQGFYPVVQLTLYLRYGIVPSDIDAGAAIIDRSNVRQVMELSRTHYR
jgi:simple sugar transport system substrate-binding protein